MRSLPARLLSVLCATLTIVALEGCASTPDAAGGGGATTYGAEVTPDPAAEGDVGDDGEPDSALVAADDGPNVGTTHEALTANGQMRTTANVNFRKGAGTSFAVISVIPAGSEVTLIDAAPSNGFLHIDWNGAQGWSSASYLQASAPSGGSSGGTGTGTVDLNGAASPDNAIARASLAMGFSYYWGGGAWLPAGPTASTKGSCSGSCPSCSHSGQYGADCSGLVAKAWQYGDKDLATNSHPYSTVDLVGSSSKWSTVSKGSLAKGDALVYNSSGHGHTVIWEKGDGWGSSTVYECKGCSYGCVHDTRTFTSNYKGIRRAGF